MKLKDKIALTVRGYRTIHELLPGYLPLAALKAVLEAFFPFINIYMSGRVITAIAQKSSLRTLAMLVLVTVTLNFVTSMLINVLRRAADSKGERFWAVYDLPLDVKIQTTDYEHIEDSKVHAMRAKIDRLGRNLGRGIPRLYWWYFDVGIKSLFQLIFSVAMVIGAFTAVPDWMNGAAASGAQAAGIGAPVAGIGLQTAAVILSPWTAAVLIGLFILSLVWDIYSKAAIARKEAGTMEALQSANIVGNFYYNLFIEYKAGKDLKLYDLKESVLGELSVFLNRFADVFCGQERIIARYESLSAVNAALTSALIYAYVAVKALLGAFSVGSIVQYVGSLTQFTSGFSGLVGVIADIFVNAEPLRQFYEFTDLPDKKYRGTLPVEKRAFCEGGDNEYEIEFRDVSFRYPGTDQYALRHVSMKMGIGERLAIVGMNGSGKTTFIKLLCRLYDPTEGQILLNGIDIRKYDYEEYMDIFSVVFQDFSLFSFSLGQNVAASVNYDADRAASCLKKAGFGDRLQTMPKGLDTCLYKDFEEDGVEISGGEAQKIALARALYKNAPFIVLDEPTAALDPIAEAEVYSRFNEIVGNKTAIYISHRLSSCRFCDEIAVFDEGRIVQRGSHETLVADERGRYHELWWAQAQYYGA